MVEPTSKFIKVPLVAHLGRWGGRPRPAVASSEQADQGVGRGPGGPPHQVVRAYFGLETVSPTWGFPGPVNFPTADCASTSVTVMVPIEFSTCRITLPVAGSVMSFTLRLTRSWAPTLTPAADPTLTISVPSSDASATSPSMVTVVVGSAPALDRKSVV